MKKIGNQTYIISNPVTILETASIVGPKEKDGPLHSYFDKCLENEFWGESFEYKPCCLVNELIPSDEEIKEIKIIKTKIKFDLIQNNCCFGMQDCMDGIVALAYENIDSYEEYPNDGRIYFMFGESFDDVERKLAIKSVLMIN